MSHFDLNLLRVFLEVYRQRSITLAAESLEMTQPGISSALKRLQGQLKRQLFVREGRGIAPTAQGVQFAEEIAPLFEQLSHAVKSLDTFDNNTKRTFKVYANEVIMHYLLAKIEQNTTLGNCHIELHPTPSQDEELIQKLNLQQVDLAIDIAINVSTGFEQQTLLSDDIVLACSQQHPRIKHAITQAEYYNEQHITLNARRQNLYIADLFTHETLASRKVMAEAESLVSQMAMIANSQAVGVTTKAILAQYQDLFSLKLVPLPFATQPINHTMIWHKRNNANAAFDWLRNQILEMMKPV